MSKKYILILFLVFLYNCENKKDKKKERSVVSIKQKRNDSLIYYTVIGWRSHIVWRANKILEQYSGKIRINKGQIGIRKGKITNGTFNIDINSLILADMKGDEKTELENLLKGKQKGKENIFFNVSKYPSAKFQIVDSYSSNENTYISGDLTINGITKPVNDFVVNFEDFKGDDSKLWMVSKDFKINRLDWNINYGSKTIEKNLVDRLIIRDEISVRIKVLFKKY